MRLISLVIRFFYLFLINLLRWWNYKITKSYRKRKCVIHDTYWLSCKQSRCIKYVNAIIVIYQIFISNNLGMGLVSEIVPVGKAVLRAIEIGKDIARMPEKCMLSDRKSLYDQENLSMDDALK